MASEGDVVNHSGDCSASAKPRMRAIGLRPSASAFSRLISSTAAAPSFRVEALAAVTVPSLVKAGRRPGTLAKSTFRYSSSSLITVVLPRLSMVTGTISSFFLPASAALALRL